MMLHFDSTTHGRRFVPKGARIPNVCYYGVHSLRDPLASLLRENAIKSGMQFNLACGKRQ
eukprot:scaffold215908_cov20-Prasinocladus_malaysianus.AAC.2